MSFCACKVACLRHRSPSSRLPHIWSPQHFPSHAGHRDFKSPYPRIPTTLEPQYLSREPFLILQIRSGASASSVALRVKLSIMVFGLSRLTPRRIILFTSASVLFWIVVIGLTPITSPLPPYTGPHEVGILDVETQVEKRVIREATLHETGKNAFELSTLAVTLYYPSSLPNAPPSRRPWARPWLPQPVSLIGQGYARLAGVSFLSPVFTFALWALGSSTVIPGVVDAPILSGSEKVLVEEGSGADGFGKILDAAEREHTELKRDEKIRTLPCVVFTHGMAGMSQSYSHYLGSIASHGYLVAAVEHRDGSGPGTFVHYPNETERRVWHMKLKDLV